MCVLALRRSSLPSLLLQAFRAQQPRAKKMSVDCISQREAMHLGHLNARLAGHLFWKTTGLGSSGLLSQGLHMMNVPTQAGQHPRRLRTTCGLSLWAAQ